MLYSKIRYSKLTAILLIKLVKFVCRSTLKKKNRAPSLAPSADTKKIEHGGMPARLLEWNETVSPNYDCIDLTMDTNLDWKLLADRQTGMKVLQL